MTQPEKTPSPSFHFPVDPYVCVSCGSEDVWQAGFLNPNSGNFEAAKKDTWDCDVCRTEDVEVCLESQRDGIVDEAALQDKADYARDTMLDR